MGIYPHPRIWPTLFQRLLPCRQDVDRGPRTVQDLVAATSTGRFAALTQNPRTYVSYINLEGGKHQCLGSGSMAKPTVFWCFPLYHAAAACPGQLATFSTLCIVTVNQLAGLILKAGMADSLPFMFSTETFPQMTPLFSCLWFDFLERASLLCKE